MILTDLKKACLYVKENNIGIVVVAYGNEDEVSRLLTTLHNQKKEGDKIVLVDNHPLHMSARNNAIKSFADHIIESKNNGFSGGCRVGASKIIDEAGLLFFINPDTYPAPNMLEEMRKGAENSFDAWMALLTLPDGKVNSAGTVVHISGLSWAGSYGEDAGIYNRDKELTAISGACMMVRSTAWKKLGGMNDEYFMYYEDTDFSGRLFLMGSKMGLLPKAHVGHDYEFSKGSYKWFYLERNRILYIARIWPGPVIAVLSPLLLLTEVGLVLVSLVQKRFMLKTKSSFYSLILLPKALKARRSIQRTRTISAYTFLRSLEPTLNNPFLGRMAQSNLLNKFFTAYYLLALNILRILNVDKET